MVRSHLGKDAAVEAAESYIGGVNTVLAKRQHLEFAGKVHTPAEVLDGLHELVQLRADVEASKASFEKAVAIENARRPTLLAFMAGLVDYVRTTFGDDPTVLVAFGLAPKRERAPQTVEEKAAAVAKRGATRSARHTMGPKAKLKVKGNVVGVEMTSMIEPPPEAEPQGQTSASPQATPAATKRTTPAP